MNRKRKKTEPAYWPSGVELQQHADSFLPELVDQRLKLRWIVILTFSPENKYLILKAHKRKEIRYGKRTDQSKLDGEHGI